MAEESKCKEIQKLAEEVLWWPIGELVQPYSDDRVDLKFEELVYLLAYEDVNEKQVYRWMEQNVSNLEIADVSSQLNSILNEKDNSSEVAVITQENKFVFVPRDKVKKIDAHRFQETVLGYMTPNPEELYKMEKLTSLMKFFHRSGNCYVERYFIDLEYRVQTILHNVDYCSLVPLQMYRKLTNALLECVRVFLHGRSSVCDSALQELATELESICPNFVKEPFEKQAAKYSVLLPPKSHAKFHEILQALDNGLRIFPLFYFDQELLVEISRIYLLDPFTEELRPVFDRVLNEIARRNEAKQALRVEMDRLYKLNLDGVDIAGETLNLRHTDTHAAIIFDAFLQIINDVDNKHCDVLIKTFTRLVHASPALFEAQANDLPEMVSGFEKEFNLVMEEKGMEITWKDAIGKHQVDVCLESK